MNYFYFSTYLTTNFKPKYINNFSEIKFFKRNKTQIYCRNLFIFLILLKHRKKHFFQNSSIFIKPYKRKIYTILRAPYRHKLARHQLVLNRYHIVSSIKIKTIKFFFFKNFDNIKKIFKYFKKFNFWFESNIIYNYRINFSFVFNYKKNFELKMFNKK